MLLPPRDFTIIGPKEGERFPEGRYPTRPAREWTYTSGAAGSRR